MDPKYIKSKPNPDFVPPPSVPTTGSNAIKKRGLSDEEVEFEIERLLRSDYVKLARQEANIRNARRNLLYNLRSLERKGRQLYEMGWRAEDAEESEYYAG